MNRLCTWTALLACTIPHFSLVLQADCLPDIQEEAVQMQTVSTEPSVPSLQLALPKVGVIPVSPVIEDETPSLDTEVSTVHIAPPQEASISVPFAREPVKDQPLIAKQEKEPIEKASLALEMQNPEAPLTAIEEEKPLAASLAEEEFSTSSSPLDAPLQETDVCPLKEQLITSSETFTPEMPVAAIESEKPLEGNANENLSTSLEEAPATAHLTTLSASDEALQEPDVCPLKEEVLASSETLTPEMPVAAIASEDPLAGNANENLSASLEEAPAAVQLTGLPASQEPLEEINTCALKEKESVVFSWPAEIPPASSEEFIEAEFLHFPEKQPIAEKETPPTKETEVQFPVVQKPQEPSILCQDVEKKQIEVKRTNSLFANIAIGAASAAVVITSIILGTN